MLKVHPLNIAISPIDDPDETSGGIVIPDGAKGRCDQGLIKYVGSKVPDYIQPGMYVIFSGYAGTLVSIEGEGTYIITRHTSVAAIIPEVSNILIPGLYFKDKDGNYFPATYEAAGNFIAMAFRNTELSREVGRSYFVPKEMDWALVDEEQKK